MTTSSNSGACACCGSLGKRTTRRPLGHGTVGTTGIVFLVVALLCGASAAQRYFTTISDGARVRYEASIIEEERSALEEIGLTGEQVEQALGGGSFVPEVLAALSAEERHYVEHVSDHLGYARGARSSGEAIVGIMVFLLAALAVILFVPGFILLLASRKRVTTCADCERPVTAMRGS